VEGLWELLRAAGQGGEERDPKERSGMFREYRAKKKKTIAGVALNAGVG